MKIFFLLCSVGLFVVSVGCITTAVVDMARGEFGLWAGKFWGAVVFHVLTMIAGLACLEKMRSVKSKADTEPPSAMEESS